MPEALRKRLRLPPEDLVPATEFELSSASDAMSAFEHICLAIPASGALIAVRDGVGLHCVGSLGDAPEVGSRIPGDFGIALECLQTGSVVSSDFSDDAQRVLRVGLSMEGVSQIHSAVAVPMRASGVIIGVISIFSQRESAIQSRDISALTRIADFWGPVMADEWFPDGIPAAIVVDAKANAAAVEALVDRDGLMLPAPVLLTESVPVVEEPILDKSAAEESAAQRSALAEPGLESAKKETAQEEVAPNAFDEKLKETSLAEAAIVLPESRIVESTATTATNVETTQPAESVNREESTTTAEPTQSRIISEEPISSETAAITEAAKKNDATVFLAPTDPAALERLEYGEPQRQTWLIVLAVFLVVLLPVWYLRAHWNHSNAAAKIAVSASLAKSPTTNGATAIPGATTPSSSGAPAKPANAGIAANTPNTAKAFPSPSPPTSKALPPDEQMPKPLPDLNTQPSTDAETSPSSPLPKPKLPALLSRILKSPKISATKTDPTASAPSAPDITAEPSTSPANEPAASSESAPSKDSATPDSAAAPAASAPEAAEPVNPASSQPPNFALAQTLKAHGGWVSSLAFSPSGQLASGSWDRTVKFWDLATGHEVHAVADKMKQVQAIAFTRDGKLLAAEDTSDTVAIFDAATGARIRELPTDKSVPSVGISWVYSIAFSPDGRWLASAVDDKTVRIWDVATGTKIRDLTGPRRPVVYAAFSPNGELVATGNDEKSIQLWNVASGAPTSTLTGHKKVINAVAFSPDGKFLASASADKTIRLWDTATGKHIRTFSSHQAAVSSISFSPDGRWLASGSWDKTVRIWNVATGAEVQTLRPDARAIYSVTFGPRGRSLAAGSEDGGVEIWQWNTAAGSSSPASANPEAKP
jgi:WD40 repeat protein